MKINFWNIILLCSIPIIAFYGFFGNSKYSEYALFFMTGILSLVFLLGFCISCLASFPVMFDLFDSMAKGIGMMPRHAQPENISINDRLRLTNDEFKPLSERTYRETDWVGNEVAEQSMDYFWFVENYYGNKYGDWRDLTEDKLKIIIGDK